MMPGRTNTKHAAGSVMMMVLMAVMTMDLLLVPSKAFAPYCSQQQRSSIATNIINHNSPSAVVVTVPSRLLAGFGSGSSKNKKKKSTKDTIKNKLKPRQQWDRFLSDELKTADIIRVACCKKDTDKWFEIGQVKSVDNAFTDAAVIRHRALMAEHARRMFPTQILVNDQLYWGYTTNTSSSVAADSEEEEKSSTVWTTVTKLNKENLPDDIDKKIGFRGNADPTGFYASSQGGLKAGDMPSSQQTGYLNMKSKGITGHTGHEVHD